MGRAKLKWYPGIFAGSPTISTRAADIPGPPSGRCGKIGGALRHSTGHLAPPRMQLNLPDRIRSRWQTVTCAFKNKPGGEAHRQLAHGVCILPPIFSARASPGVPALSLRHVGVGRDQRAALRGKSPGCHVRGRCEGRLTPRWEPGWWLLPCQYVVANTPA